MIRGPLLSPLLLAAGLLAGCASAAKPVPVKGTPMTYRFSLREPGVQNAPVRLRALLTLSTGQEYWMHLEASPGESAAVAVSRWAGAINRNYAGMAEQDGYALLVHRVVKMETQGGVQGMRIRQIGPTK